MKLIRLASSFFSLCFFFFLLCFPDFTGRATLSSMLFVAKTVFPSLFMFLCLSSILTSSPGAGLLYRFPFGVELTVWLLGVLCGYPIGARCAKQLYESGSISKTRAEVLCGFSGLASAPFLVGVVGNTLLEDAAFGAALTVLQAASSLLCALVLFWIYRPRCQGVCFPQTCTRASLATQIGTSAQTMLEVGGMLIFFGVAAESAKHFAGDGVFSLALRGLLEFSSGCRDAALLGEAGKWPILLFVGFGGLCVLGQISAVTRGKLSLKPYLLGKLLQTAFMACLFLLFS